MEKINIDTGTKPSQQFIQDFVRFYFNHRANIQYVQSTIDSFRDKGLDMEMFYWTDPDFHVNDDGLRTMLREEPYSFKKSEIELLLGRK